MTDQIVTEAAPGAPDVPDAPAAPKPRDRRVLRAVARWTAAVVVCAGLGTAAAAGITALDRTDVPGLATEDDGRWAYPKLTRPALPAGSPRPFTPGNTGEVHHADLRALLLPAPAGAKPDAKINGGWGTVDQFLSVYEKDAVPALKQALADAAPRGIAARAWTMPDGTTTRIHLVRFSSVAYAEGFKDNVLKVGSDSGPALVGASEGRIESDLSGEIRVAYTAVYPFTEKAPHGPEQTRWAYVQAGDTLALIVQSRKGTAPLVPFQQTVALQNQLLG
ncbi:hypothetical protein [Streptomyces purpureus]|uniref:Uncharacterized protein n=1 Tax=Streptomyces purpureus TaxID=1951 RepID=A0A918HCY7_9ACTN|nr:hypothetical protein [Streptomyces purpureus]GGT55274.1 hypothetical protein GCM10014713_56260 [Streptomyces purpureus]